jgi:transcriptional regulator with XRE-family HTH domain
VKVTSYGERLRELRAEKGLTLREVEERGGPSKDTMSLAERGIHKPHPQTLGRIAKVYGMTVAELREELEPPPSSLEEALAQAGSPTRYHALPEDAFKMLWKGRSAADRAALNRDFLKERELIHPLITRWRDMPLSPKRSELYAVWFEAFKRFFMAIVANDEAAQAEAEAARRDGDEERARGVLEEAEEFAKSAA